MTRFIGSLQTLSLVFFSREWVTTRHHVRITSFHVFKWSFCKYCSICFLLLLFYSNRIILLLLLFMSKFINSLEGKFCIKLRSRNLLWKPSSCSRSKLVTTAGSWNKIDCWIIDQNSIRPTLPNVRIRSCCYYYYSKFEMGLLKGTVAALVCLHYCVCIEILLLLSNCEWSGSSFPPPISLQQMNANSVMCLLTLTCALHVGAVRHGLGRRPASPNQTRDPTMTRAFSRAICGAG